MLAACSSLAPRVGWTQLDFNARSRYESTIKKSRDRLLELNKQPGTGEAALAAYALVKSGVDKSHAQVREITAGTVARVNSGAYGSGPEPQHHVYDAGCDAMLLAEIDPVAYRPQLETLRDYLIRKQLSNGSWYYPNPPTDAGDTSITQFALLGLWAVKRAGLDVPQVAWERCARWLMSTQRKDGGFCYHPHETNLPHHVTSTHTMTAAGCGSLLVIRRMLYSMNPLSDVDMPPPPPRKRFGILENLASEREAAAKAKRDFSPTVPEVDIRQAARQAQTWLAQHYDAKPPGYVQYFHYACERTGALLNTEKFGEHRWYDEGAKTLIAMQRPSGDWEDAASVGGAATPVRNISFALLFLCRATQTIITPPPAKVRLHGGGLLGGGKGLPDDLSQVDMQNGEIKRRVPKTSLDALLTELERPAAEVNDAAQIAVVDAVQLDQRDELIGQIDRLKKLLSDPRPEVRMVAAWGLGRSDDVRQTPLLIASLQDPDLEVAAEIGLALCVLSRQPEGVRAAGGKGDLVPKEPPEPREQEDAESYNGRTQAWRAAATTAWREWYLQVRPYDERDDRQEVRKK
jgi:hypothetical protein